MTMDRLLPDIACDDFIIPTFLKFKAYGV